MNIKEWIFDKMMQLFCGSYEDFLDLNEAVYTGRFTEKDLRTLCRYSVSVWLVFGVACFTIGIVVANIIHMFI